MIGKQPFKGAISDAIDFYPVGLWVRAGRVEISVDNSDKLLKLGHHLAEKGFNVNLHAGAKGFTAYGSKVGLDGLEIDVKIDKRLS